MHVHGKKNKKYIDIKYIEIYIIYVNITYYMCSIYTVADTEVTIFFFDSFQNI